MMQAGILHITIDGKPVQVAQGTSVAAAILSEGQKIFRRSVRGQVRGPLCGMGSCFECRVSINGRAGERACLLLCEDGMEVRRDDA